MPTEIYEEPLELEVEVLEALPPEPGSPAFRDAYPLPALRRTGRFQVTTFRSLVIENAFLRVVVVPELGGRILRILDKRTDTSILGDSARLDLVDGGPRGVESRAGIRWSAVDQRLDDLGPVDCQVVEPEDEESNGGVWLFSLVPGKPISVHVGISVPSDKCEILVEIQTYNRQFRELDYNPQFKIPVQGAASYLPYKEGLALYEPEWLRGLNFQFGSYHQRHFSMNGDFLRVSKFEKAPYLENRQLDSWGFSIFPLSGFTKLKSVSKSLALGFASDSIEIASFEPDLNGKVVILTESAETLEAPVQITNWEVKKLKIGGTLGQLSAVGVLDGNRNELLRWESLGKEVLLNVYHGFGTQERNRNYCDVAGSDFSIAKMGILSSREESNEKARYSLHAFTTNFKFRSAAFALLGFDSIRHKDYEKAQSYLENALLYNGVDYLTWWMQAAAKRLAEGPEVERPELLNAHYLAPLEPILRAEAFLTAPDNIKLLDSFKEDPAALIEVACILFECKMFEDLSRWIHAALQQREVPMLRYILAAALLKSTKMQAEAASEVRLAGAVEIEPPYASSWTERGVLRALAKAFPDDKRLQELHNFLVLKSLRPI